jgi:ABC-type nitrate/sulfonate/bicarbonate transport system substrate-binding protein
MNLPNDIAPILRHSITPILRCFIPGCFAAAILLAPAASEAATLRIGYQKAASTLVLLKAHGTLEKKLAPLNVEVKWLEFAAGPQLLEGLNLGSIDFGYVGEVPPIFALAAGAPLVYTAFVNRHQYFVSTRSFSEKNAEVVKILMQELGEVGQWVRDHYAEAAKELAPIQGLEPDIIEASLRHYEHIYKPIDDAVLADQQRIADTFYELKLIPRKLSVKDAVVP